VIFFIGFLVSDSKNGLSVVRNFCIPSTVLKVRRAAKSSVLSSGRSEWKKFIRPITGTLKTSAPLIQYWKSEDVCAAGEYFFRAFELVNKFEKFPELASLLRI